VKHIIYERDCIITYNYKDNYNTITEKLMSKNNRDLGFTKKNDIFEKNVLDKSCRV